MNKLSVLFIIFTYFAESLCQCVNDKYYNHYHGLILNEKDNIQNVFDGILNKYGDIDNILENLLRKLNETANKADSDLNNLENDNKHLNETNKDLDTKLESLLEKLNKIEHELELVNISKSLPEEIEDAQKSSNKTVLDPVTLDAVSQKEELEKWDEFLKDLNEVNYSKNVMNIPNSVSDELNLLEKLMTEVPDTSCFNTFHTDLKALFAELANLFDFSTFQDDLDKIKDQFLRNKANADDIVKGTNEFLQKENELKNINRLTNETLQLAEEIEALKNNIELHSGHNEEIIKDRLEKLEEEHKNELKKLEKKYNIKEGTSLLNKLEITKQQIENINLQDVEKDIEKYILAINCYTCILEKCEKANSKISDCRADMGADLKDVESICSVS